ncbi:cell division protein ZapA [Pseudomonas sp. EL_65y_Pfl2_R95]|uniref:cell division protein ZapA n=1 Tax=Pseudomonas sp. EL_65y_Pfl2_R95 TaxID=3088698 RepID=UPI0030DA1A59
MNRTDTENVSVISILGRDYSIKAPEGKAEALSASALMLKKLLAETKQASPTLVGEKLLVLTALKLCAQQLEMQQQHQVHIEQLEAQISERVADINSLIREA